MNFLLYLCGSRGDSIVSKTLDYCYKQRMFLLALFLFFFPNVSLCWLGLKLLWCKQGDGRHTLWWKYRRTVQWTEEVQVLHFSRRHCTSLGAFFSPVYLQEITMILTDSNSKAYCWGKRWGRRTPTQSNVIPYLEIEGCVLTCPLLLYCWRDILSS